MDSASEKKKNIIEAAWLAVDELIRISKEKIITDSGDDLTADRLKNAAATKKLCVFDAFEIVNRIEEEQKIIDSSEGKETKEKEDRLAFGGFAEKRSRQ